MWQEHLDCNGSESWSCLIHLLWHHIGRGGDNPVESKVVAIK